MTKRSIYFPLHLGASVISKSGATLQLASDNLQQAINEEWILELRDLGEMTEEECDEYNRLSDIMHSLNKVQDRMKTEASTTLYLLSRELDLFDLTHQGLAKHKRI